MKPLSRRVPSSYEIAHEAYESSLFEDIACQLFAQQDEIARLKSENADLRSEIIEVHHANNESHDLNVKIGRKLIELAHQLDLDPKTGLLNAVAFERIADEITARSRRSSDNETYSLIFADLDNFGEFNKQLGEDHTDEMYLQPVATIMREMTRQDDIVARWGGDEFALLLQANPLGARTVIAKIRLEINNLNSVRTENLDNEMPQLGISAGIARYNQEAGYQKIMKRAVIALRNAKRIPGKNTTILWPSRTPK